METKLTVHSDAWPKDSEQKIHSQFHEVLARTNRMITKDKITYRLLEDSDLREAKDLHREWFPVEYSENYYTSITKYKRNIAVGAFYHYKGRKSRLFLLGVIFANIELDDSVSDRINKRGRCYKFMRSLNCFHKEDEIMYIMTIGVADEGRRMGIGKELVEQATRIALSRFPKCKGISLHVIEHNHSAIAFYKKLGYVQLVYLEKYYNIKYHAN